MKTRGRIDQMIRVLAQISVMFPLLQSFHCVADIVHLDPVGDAVVTMVPYVMINGAA